MRNNARAAPTGRNKNRGAVGCKHIIINFTRLKTRIPLRLRYPARCPPYKGLYITNIQGEFYFTISYARFSVYTNNF